MHGPHVTKLLSSGAGLELTTNREVFVSNLTQFSEAVARHAKEP
jgi:hypothetical protein